MTDDEQTRERDEEETEERDAEASSGGDGDESEEVQKARKASEEEEEAKQKVKDLEDDPPDKLEDWPDDKAKYETFGGPEGEESYEDSVTSKLGPSSLRFRDDGSVEIEGEEVDNPDEYKGDPIPGGPTDPRVGEERAYGEPDLTDETSIDPENPPDEDGDGESNEDGGGSKAESEQGSGDGESKKEGSES